MLFLFFGIAGCKKLDNGQLPDNTVLQKTAVSNPKNPYSVTNVRKAFAKILMNDIQLINSNSAKYAKGKIMFSNGGNKLAITKTMTAEESMYLAENGINATHYYIKFKPRNDAEYEKLIVDSSLMIYPFPLDNEISPYSGNYRDEDLPAGVPTYQYAAVPVNYPLPDVPYEKLEDLCLPDELNNSMVTVQGAGGASFSINARSLIDASICAVAQEVTLRLAEMLPDDCGGGGGNGGGGGGYTPVDPYKRGNEWRPNGRITVEDEVKGQVIGVQGIKVRARRWFTTYTGITDADGYYAVNGWFTRPANYWLNFERYEFSVIDDTRPMGKAREISGPKVKASWNVQFTGYDKFCSAIFRAAFHYYYKDIQGLRTPPQNAFWKTQMKLRARYYPDSNDPFLAGNAWPIRRLFNIGEFIHIFYPNNTNTARVFATTIHELGHAVHWLIDKDRYNQNDIATLKLAESWARGVQWYITKMEYPNYNVGIPNSTYTNVVIDLIDDYGDFTNNGFWDNRDLVSGYTIVQIQNALLGAQNLNDLKYNLKNMYENPTEQHLDVLFDAWLNF